METSTCNRCQHSVDASADKCPHCGGPIGKEIASEDTPICWICGKAALSEPDMEGKFACQNHFTQGCWICLEPVRRSEAWKLSTEKGTYYFHHPQCYLRGKKKIRRLRKFTRVGTITCDPRDPIGSFSTQAGCLGTLAISLILASGIALALALALGI